jgi:hypothetical protein
MIVRGLRLAGTSGRNRRSLGSKYLLMFPVGYLGALKVNGCLFESRWTGRILLNVRYWHKADNPTAPAFVRYRSNSGHQVATASRAQH